MKVKKVWEQDPHAHLLPVLGLRHLQLVNRDHLEDLVLGTLLLPRPQHLVQL